MQRRKRDCCTPSGVFVYGKLGEIDVYKRQGFYSRQVKTSSASYSGRTALAYVTENMHQNDENGAIADGTFDCLLYTS